MVDMLVYWWALFAILELSDVRLQLKLNDKASLSGLTTSVGTSVGLIEGDNEGPTVGLVVGEWLGKWLGDLDGCNIESGYDMR